MKKNNILEVCKKYADDLIKFTQELIRIKSYSDEEGEIAITGDKQSPDTIQIKDNTNQKINTFEYRKLTDEEVAKGVTKGGVKLTGLGGRKGPFYILTKAIDTQGNLRNRHPEVYQLELDDNDDTTNYHLEQYDGMNGSGVSSMQWENRATRKHHTHRRK